jgi:hypothetical protein
MFDELLAAGATVTSGGPGDLRFVLVGGPPVDVWTLDDPLADVDPDDFDPDDDCWIERPITATDVLDYVMHAPADASTAAMLTAVTGLPLNEYDEVVLMQAWARQTAHSEAQTLRAAVPAAGHPLTRSFGAQEVAAAQGITVTAADRMLHLARRLTGALRRTGSALLDGTVSIAAARVIAAATAALSDEQARAVEDRVLARAAHVTLRSLREAANRAVASVAPDEFAERAKQRGMQSEISVMPLDDGVAGITGTLPLADAAVVDRALDDWADRHATDLPDLTRAQRRAAAVVAWARDSLAAPGAPRRHGRRARDVVGLVIDLPTLLGLVDHPGYVPGFGPVPAAAARLFAAGGRLVRMVTDPVTGHLLDFGKQAHDPPQELVDYLLNRDVESAFPTSNLSARRCDLDHVVAHPTGATSAGNLVPLDRRGHNAKTHAGWSSRRHDDGAVTWTSPRGHTYEHTPTDYRLGP